MVNSKENSQDKQERLHCFVGKGVDGWDCYKDCAFWDGEKCTSEKNVQRPDCYTPNDDVYPLCKGDSEKMDICKYCNLYEDEIGPYDND